MYFIKGNELRGQEVIKLLVSKGGINSAGLEGLNESGFYYTSSDNVIHFTFSACEEVLCNLGTELHLPEAYEPAYGETVLVRDLDTQPWEVASFTFKIDNSISPYHTFGGLAWMLCIPFDKNKVGTI